MAYNPPDADDYSDELDLAHELAGTPILGQAQAEVFVLRDIVGQGRQETADLLDKDSVNTVDSALQDARRNVNGAREAIELIDQFREKSRKSLLERLQASDSEGQIREIANTTDLSEQSAAIVVYSEQGYDPDRIATEIGRASGYIQGRIDELRERYRSLDDEIEELRRTRDALAEL